MKKTLLLLTVAFAGVMLSNCGTNCCFPNVIADVTEASPLHFNCVGNPLIPTLVPPPIQVDVTIDPAFISTAWTATTTQTWIHVTNLTATSFDVSVDINTGALRTGTVTVTALNGDTFPVTVTQEALVYSITRELGVGEWDPAHDGTGVVADPNREFPVNGLSQGGLNTKYDAPVPPPPPRAPGVKIETVFYFEIVGLEFGYDFDQVDVTIGTLAPFVDVLDVTRISDPTYQIVTVIYDTDGIPTTRFRLAVNFAEYTAGVVPDPDYWVLDTDRVGKPMVIELTDGTNVLGTINYTFPNFTIM